MTPYFISLIERNLHKEGVMNIKLSESLDPASADIRTLVSKQELKNTTANIKALRSTILSDKESAYWSNLIHEEYFYSVDGCRDVWFNQENEQEFLDNILHLLETPDWTLAKVLNHYGKTISTTLAEKNLQKIAKEQSKLSDYSLYFIKQ